MRRKNIMKKRFLALGMAACMAVSLTACGGSSEKETTVAETAKEETTTAEGESKAEESSAEESKADTADIETVTEGTLTVATSPDFAPYEFYEIGRASCRERV